MPIPWLALAMAGGAAASHFGQRSANTSNERLAREQMAFQERMSSSAYQRGVVDLEKAGLNKILAAGGGSASSPQGQSAQMRNTAEGLGHTAKELPMMMAQLKNIEANTNKTKAETGVVKKNELKAGIEVSVINKVLDGIKGRGSVFDTLGISESSAKARAERIKENWRSGGGRYTVPKSIKINRSKN